MNVNFNNVPNELKGLKQWIMWKYEVKEGKKTKVPYQIDGIRASVTNPEHWGMLSDVKMAMLINDQGFDGVGFVFTEGDDFTGVDIDGSIDGKEPDEKTKFIIKMLASYTELSPSKTGVHIIVKGQVPQGYKNKNTKEKIECYDKSRFFTFTGDKVIGERVEERSGQLSKFADRYLVKAERVVTNAPELETPDDIKNMDNTTLWNLMFKSKNGEKIKSLYAGDIIDGDHSSADLSLCNQLAFWTNKDAKRMDEMFRNSSLYRIKWDEKRGHDTYGQITIARAINDTKSTIADKMAKKGKKMDVAMEASDEISLNLLDDYEFDLSDLGNGKRVAHFNRHKMRHNKSFEWVVWDGKRWKQDDSLEVELMVADTLANIINDKPRDEDHEKAIMAWYKRCAQRNVREAALKDAKPRLNTPANLFDKKPMMFNCSNGTINLTNGEFVRHDPNMYLTQISGVEYDKEAKCPNWINFINDIMVNEDQTTNEELVEFMQRVIGYSLTGSNDSQAVFLLYGGGRNGKSTFLSVIQELLGEYSRQSDPKTFTKNNSKSGANNDIARLAGARFVYGSETEIGDELSESLVKQVTGGEKLSARFLHKEHFEFVPEFKLFFATNHKPTISGIDEGIWRRMKLIPFLKKVKENEVKADLKASLLKELPGILNWALEGCIKWYNEGSDLKEPRIVKDAVNEYREEMDSTLRFVKECCETEDSNAKQKALDVYLAYENWCWNNRIKQKKDREFYASVESKGYERRRGSKGVWTLYGLSVKEEHSRG